MIESGRWRGLLREERRCRECQSGKIEAVHAPLVVGVSCMAGAQSDKLSCGA